MGSSNHMCASSPALLTFPPLPLSPGEPGQVSTVRSGRCCQKTVQPNHDRSRVMRASFTQSHTLCKDHSCSRNDRVSLSRYLCVFSHPISPSLQHYSFLGNRPFLCKAAGVLLTWKNTGTIQWRQADWSSLAPVLLRWFWVLGKNLTYRLHR